MLADEGFFIAQFVEPFYKLHVALERQRWVLADTMKRSHEDPKFHFFFTGLIYRRGACPLASYRG
jgi:hypothetical protein